MVWGKFVQMCLTAIHSKMIPISSSALAFLMTPSFVLNQLSKMVEGMKRGEETSTNENV
jgi:hypothetical protein